MLVCGLLPTKNSRPPGPGLSRTHCRVSLSVASSCAVHAVGAYHKWAGMTRQKCQPCRRETAGACKGAYQELHTQQYQGYERR